MATDVKAPERAYTLPQIRLALGILRDGKPVPESTFRYWCDQLGVVRDETGRYTADDFNIFVGLINWLDQDHAATIAQYKHQLYEQRKNQYATKERPEPTPKAVWLPAEIEWSE